MDRKLKVLFVSSGNSKNGISPIIKNQGESLRKQGVDISYFTIRGKGIKGYLRNVKPLRQYIRTNNFDVIHAHYSLSAFVASLSGASPLVVSLMGSDLKSEKYFKVIIKLFNKFSWSKIIVKSQDMKNSLGINNVEIIPNGVDFDKFKPMNQMECKRQLGWDLSKKQILFAANPIRPEKNYKLAQESIELLNDSNIELKVLQDVPNEMMPIYHNAADVILLTSLWEGSPNVIKEAMACNRPIVTVDVGDVKELLKGVEGCFVEKHIAADMLKSLSKALIVEEVNSRERLVELKLDSINIAVLLIGLYKTL